MNSKHRSVHAAAAVLIDVLLAILVMLAYFFMHESGAPSRSPAAAPAVNSRTLPAKTSVLHGPRMAPPSGEKQAPTPFMAQVRREGGRLVPLLARRAP